jgi:hypothetical protein
LPESRLPGRTRRASGCDLLRGCRNRRRRRFHRHHDPGNQVRDKAESRHDRHHQPDDAQKGYIQVQVFREASANSTDLPLRPRAHQVFLAGDRPHAFSAVRAQIGVIRYHFSAVVAVHGSTPEFLEDNTPALGYSIASLPPRSEARFDWTLASASFSARPPPELLSRMANLMLRQGKSCVPLGRTVLKLHDALSFQLVTPSLVWSLTCPL